MIFVSINPFALRRFFFFLIAAIGLSCLSCFGQSVLLSVKNTPYDRQMTRIRPFLTSVEARPTEDLSLGLVNLWMGNLRCIPYGFTPEWKTPEETESGAPADCKAKAITLYERMQAHGAKNLRLIIGKRTPRSRSTHAWLEWDTAAGHYVLDPTFNWRACRIEDLGRGDYVAYFAFEGEKKYRVTQTSLVAQN